MTVQSQVSRASYDGNGVTVTFPVPFRFLDNAQVRVILRRPDGGEVQWAETTDYTLAGAGQASGGTLTAIVPPAIGERLVILRNVPLTQEIDYIEGEPFPAETHEMGLDKLTMIAQQLNEQQNRVIALPPTDDTRVVLPTATERAGRYLAFDGDGNPVAAADPGNLQVVISPYMEQLLDTADAQSLRHEILPAFGQQDAGKVLMVDAGGADYVLAGPLGGFRNKIINGSCLVAQRGPRPIIPGRAAYGGCDRIFVAPLRFSTMSGTIQQGGAPGNPISTSGYCQALTGLTTTGSGTVWFGTKLESKDISSLSGKTVTLRVRIQHDLGGDIPCVLSLYKANAPDDFSATTLVYESAPIVVGSGPVTEIAQSVTLGPADALSGLQVNVQVGNDTGIGAVTNRSIYVGELSLEEGSVATPFEQVSFGEELNLCERYFWKTYDPDTAPGTQNTYLGAHVWNVITSSGNSVSSVRFPGAMAKSPLVTAYNPLSGAVGSARDTTVSTDRTVTIGSVGERGCYVAVSSGTAGNELAVHLTADAEL